MKGLALLFATTLTASAADADWSTYLGDKASSHYSTLTDITPENVARLAPAWTYQSGGTDAQNRSQIQCNPLVVGGVLYGTSADFQLFAVDAATGEKKWSYDPASEGFPKGGVNRGLVHWSGDGESRIFYANDRFLHAIDAKTGKRVPSFAKQGSLDLKANLGANAGDLYLSANTPGVIFRDLLIMGMRLGEGPAPAAPGPVRAFNVRTGELVWRFNTIPLPGEPGYETWPPEAHKSVGGANVWTGFALDEARGLVFCPTGSAAFDFWGGDRIGQNLYANCLIALDANTGKRVWHFQFVHHDLWDRDLPAPPNLITVKQGGRSIAAVAQVTKSGHVFVFERETGKPLFPIEEKPVLPSDLQGESAWPTQPFPAKPAPFARQVLDEAQVTDVSPEARKAVLERLAQVRKSAPFTPPSEQGTIIFPGFDGGAEWGGAAADPDGILYVNSNDMPWILTMVPAQGGGSSAPATGEAIFAQVCAACHGTDRKGNPAQNVPSLVDIATRLKKPDVDALLKTGKGVMPSFAFLTDTQRGKLAAYLFNEAPANDPGRKEEPGGEGLAAVPYSTTGYNRWLDPQGYPAVKPPWGSLHAIDLNDGSYKWSVPLGEYPELTAKGIPKTGTEGYGGPVVTAGGLIFIAASRDEHIRAFDRKTGKELWKAKLPAGGYATPATYSVHGRQYLVVACGGGKMGTKSGDAYVAFALPE
ncbi:PQQ-binding-like beta-propeller repeat protein [Luteolibacter sp. Populi]|uniref:outer membrane protein assembly factor BamB family protein n=1 Tax=Luteolibacter sp. Populi TaxID=3230487 RepID=UPI003467A51D